MSLPGQGADAPEDRQHLRIGLQFLGDPPDDSPSRLTGHGLGQRLDAVEENVGRAAFDARLAELFQPRNGVAVRRLARMLQELQQPALDLLGHHVLPAAGLIVNELDVEPDDVEEQPFGQAMLAHHPGGQLASLGRQLQMAITLRRRGDRHAPCGPRSG